MIHDIVLCQVKDLIAIAPKLFLAFGCIIYGGCRIIGISVYDDEQLCLGTVKVGNEAKNAFLAAKTEGIGPHEVKPKMTFGFIHGPPHSGGKASVFPIFVLLVIDHVSCLLHYGWVCNGFMSFIMP